MNVDYEPIREPFKINAYTVLFKLPYLAIEFYEPGRWNVCEIFVRETILFEKRSAQLLLD